MHPHCNDCQGAGCAGCGDRGGHGAFGGWGGIQEPQPQLMAGAPPDNGVMIPENPMNGYVFPGSAGYSLSQNQGANQSMSTGQSTSTSGSQSGTGMVAGMYDVYKELLGKNERNYQNVLGSYNQGQDELRGNLQSLYPGYGQVQSGVMNTLGMGQVLGKDGNWGVAAPAAQAIADTHAQRQAATTQQMTNAGLGNTTAAGNLQAQNAAMAAKSYGDLGAQLAGQAAQYQSNIGLAGQQGRLQGAGMQADAAWREAGALAGYNFGNTAGNLTGQFSTSGSQANSNNFSQSTGYNLGQSLSEHYSDYRPGQYRDDLTGMGGWQDMGGLQGAAHPFLEGDPLQDPGGGMGGGGGFGDEGDWMGRLPVGMGMMGAVGAGPLGAMPFGF